MQRCVWLDNCGLLRGLVLVRSSSHVDIVKEVVVKIVVRLQRLVTEDALVELEIPEQDVSSLSIDDVVAASEYAREQLDGADWHHARISYTILPRLGAVGGRRGRQVGEISVLEE